MVGATTLMSNPTTTPPQGTVQGSHLSLPIKVSAWPRQLQPVVPLQIPQTAENAFRNLAQVWRTDQHLVCGQKWVRGIGKVFWQIENAGKAAKRLLKITSHCKKFTKIPLNSLKTMSKECKMVPLSPSPCVTTFQRLCVNFDRQTEVKWTKTNKVHISVPGYPVNGG